MNTPTQEEVKKHFCQAKTIKCLFRKINVDISACRGFVFSELDNQYTTIGGSILVWKDGVYAEIIDKKKEPCKCNDCNEKK